MALRYFYFLYPEKGEVQALLDLAVFALDPNEKWPAHVTVAGPFSRKPRSRAPIAFNGTVFSLGVWNFFSDGINTVYLKVGMQDIWRYWKKPDFVGRAVPHLSLYNGKDPEFARKIFSRLFAINPYFAFQVSGSSLVKAVSGQQQMNLRERLDPSILEQTSGLTVDEIKDLSQDERLTIAVAALAKCSPNARPEKPLFYQ